MEDHLVHINVGGVYYTTRRSTLAQSNSFFAGAARTHPDCSELFVDRDPTHFRHVLNWLRGVHHLPQDENVLRELEWEADYYCMPDMSDAIRRAPAGPTIVTALHSVRDELRQR